VLAIVIGLALVFAGPAIYGHFLAQRFAEYIIFGIGALAVGLIAGHARLLNIGVGANFGVAAYSVAILTNHGVLNPFWLMVGALVVSVVVSGLFAVYAVVATGLEYLLLTLLTTVAFFGLPLLFSGPTGGENGLGAQGAVTISFGWDPLVGNTFYWLVAGVASFWVALSWYLLAARAGRVMTAIGRNPIRAAAMGYSVHSYRVAITLYSGLMAGSAGWLYALDHAFVFPDLMGLANSLNFVIYSLIGGVEAILGPLLGAAGLRYLNEYTGQQSTQSQLYIAAAILIVVYLMPNGVLGSWRRLVAMRSGLRQVLSQGGGASQRLRAAVQMARGQEPSLEGLDTALEDQP
jgi:ABC-type branched-subunit amino acid transport system permease subunit